METIAILGKLGINASFGLSVIGAVFGAFVVGSGTIGAWKKCFVQNKPAPFIMIAFAGQPLTNVIYGFITMNTLAGSVTLDGFQLLYAGVFAGIGIGGAAYAQCYCAACASDAYAETGQGFGNYMMVIGVCETIALFVMVFTMLFAS
ncbi:MAG: V-type ATP synthase subunit K [Treponema sp.]|jgi:V/A-type H+-transporting ATPase subunit K|nr:V-type ATP synthase subunit K [Treponema sp.]